MELYLEEITLLNFVLLEKSFDWKTVFYKDWNKKKLTVGLIFLCLTLQKTISHI